jgi:hypothetical protein
MKGWLAMPRLIVTVSKQMDRVLKQESERTSAPMAALIRQAIEEWAQKRGIEINDDVTWGGVRPSRNEPDEEQQMAVVRG